MSWLRDVVVFGLRSQCPQGYVENEKAVRPIARRLINTGGVCPCYHEEWNDETPDEDKLCMCKTFRETGECHCNLYIKE